MLVWWVGAVALSAVAVVVVLFNDLVAARNQVRAAWSDIDVQLTRRHDLVPQLVGAVQGYAGHERSTLTRALEDRSVVQATLMRSTIHMVAADDFWSICAGIRASRREWFRLPSRGRACCRSAGACCGPVHGLET